jgi:hypothetical protein
MHLTDSKLQCRGLLFEAQKYHRESLSEENVLDRSRYSLCSALQPFFFLLCARRTFEGLRILALEISARVHPRIQSVQLPPCSCNTEEARCRYKEMVAMRR